jgi:cell division protein FtsL
MEGVLQTPPIAEQQMATAAPQPQFAQPQVAPTQPSFFGSINGVELLVGVAIVTFFAFGIYYFKTQTKVVNPAIQTVNDRIDKLDSDLAKVEDVVMPQHEQAV